MRCGEARHLGVEDVSFADKSLVVRNGKSGKIRFLPLHPSTAVALARYAELRDSYLGVPDSGCFFRTERCQSLGKAAVEGTFSYLRRVLGWTAQGRARVPRIHDIRHTFVVRRVLAWYEEGHDIDGKILALATYLGHVRVSDTYWYLSAVPELLAATSRRFEHFARNREERVP
jgi:integrase